MHVFLTGSSGYIGSAVAERLRAAGHRVTGLARSDAAASRLSAAGIQPIRGNFAEPRSINVAAGAADAVISMATTYDPDVDGPAIDAILTALAGSNKPMIYTSGIWSHGDTDGKVVDESSPPWPATLVQWRQAVEERVLDAAREGIRTVVIRPAIVYGRGGGIPAGFVDSTRNEGAARFVGTGLNRWALRTRLEDARKTLGAYADALVLDQQATGNRAQELLGWRPSRPDIITDIEHGSYRKKG